MPRLARFFLTVVALLLPILALAQDHVRWSVTLPPDAKPNSVATATLHADIDEGWHLYSQTKTDGPNPTTITAVPPLTLEGKVEQATPIRKVDPNFGIEVEFYELKADFKAKVKLGADPKAGSLAVRYQVCNDRVCVPPKTVDVPLSGGAAQTASAAKTSGGEKQGLLAFMGGAFLAGLLSLLLPCTFPMVPITVTFFTKRRESLGGKGVLSHAAAYCFGIIGAFTGVGLLVTALFGASGTQKLGTNPYVNIGLALVFIVLALNLFGILTITLPPKVTNAFAPHKRGGLLAPVLMGLTFTLTSFTCTVPFIGAILVSAANGDYLYPAMGMLAYSSAFALPFFLLALFPEYLAKLPKSGAWMDTIKAFMGFLELAAALKFVSNVDLVWGTGLISRATFLWIWVVIFAAAALFLLRVIKLPHVDMPAKLGRGRLVTVGLTALTAIWLAIGAGGTSLGELEAFLPPSHSAGWDEDYAHALAVARQERRPMLIDFTGVACTNCRWMEKNMFPRPEVEAQFKNYVLTRLFTDREKESDRKNQELMQRLTNKVTLPTYVILSPDEKVLAMFEGSTRTPSEFVSFLRPKSGAVASR